MCVCVCVFVEINKNAHQFNLNKNSRLFKFALEIRGQINLNQKKSSLFLLLVFNCDTHFKKISLLTKNVDTLIVYVCCAMCIIN